MAQEKRLTCLYLATFDPTVSATGTSTRGRLFLKHFCKHYATHLVHLQEKHDEGRDHELMKQLKSCISIAYSPFSYFLFSPALYRAAREILRHNKIDFIFADFEKSGWYASLLTRNTPIPYIYSSHNVEYLRYIDFGKTNRARFLLVPYMYMLERNACKQARLTIAISDPDADVFRKWVPEERLAVLPCAFDEAAINPAHERHDRQPPIVLMVGNYRNPGNRDGAYTAVNQILPAVLKRRPHTIFRFAGKDFPEDIRHPNVQNAGFVENLMHEYARATVIIAPVSIGGGIKIKVIEALATGKPLVTTEKGMEGIDETGLKNLTICAVTHFADAIVRVFDEIPEPAIDNWGIMAVRYGSHTQLRNLSTRIETDVVQKRGVATDTTES